MINLEKSNRPEVLSEEWINDLIAHIENNKIKHRTLSEYCSSVDCNQGYISNILNGKQQLVPRKSLMDIAFKVGYDKNAVRNNSDQVVISQHVDKVIPENEAEGMKIKLIENVTTGRDLELVHNYITNREHINFLPIPKEKQVLLIQALALDLSRDLSTLKNSEIC